VKQLIMTFTNGRKMMISDCTFPIVDKLKRRVYDRIAKGKPLSELVINTDELQELTMWFNSFNYYTKDNSEDEFELHTFMGLPVRVKKVSNED